MRNFRGLLCLLLAAPVAACSGTRKDEVAHSAVIFLIDPQGRIAAIRDDDDSASSLSRAIAAVLPS
jgi:cytochrome oxidase Cu insertion factor (SCO1/SenC/PrrC family)